MLFSERVRVCRRLTLGLGKLKFHEGCRRDPWSPKMMYLVSTSGVKFSVLFRDNIVCYMYISG